MKKLILSVFVATICIVQQANAVPASPRPIEKTQSDGTVVTVRIRGDEYLSWLESLDGYTLMYNKDKDVVFAAHNTDGDLQPTDILYRGQDIGNYPVAEQTRIAHIPKGLRYSPMQVGMIRQIRQMTAEVEYGAPSSKNTPGANVTPVVGQKNILCILAEFSDRPMQKQLSEFDALMNQEGYNFNGSSGSVRDYFLANSYGKLDVTITVVGPVTLPNTQAYYAERPSGRSCNINFPKDAATAADPYVDFSEYAVNGRVPTFHIIFAGYGDESIGDGQQIWSHQSQFVSPLFGMFVVDPIMYDSVWVGVSYSCSPELNAFFGDYITGIGTIAHEMTHAFGAPDYYDVDYYSSGGFFEGTGEWDLMAAGVHNNDGYTPAQINMFQKILFGWVDPIELNEPTSVANMPNSVDSAMAYTITVNADNGEMYVLENRQKIGFDAYVPGHGLLIYHIHSSALSGTYGRLNVGHPQRAYIVAAGRDNAIPTGTPDSYGYTFDETTTFGSPNNKTTFNGSSTPQMFYWDGSNGIPVSDKPITNITRNSTTRTVSFSFMGAPDPNTAISDTRHTPLQIYPNPITGNNYELQITNYNWQPGDIIELYDTQGKRLFVSPMSFQSLETTIDMQPYPPGTYILKIGNYTAKIVKSSF